MRAISRSPLERCHPRGRRVLKKTARFCFLFLHLGIPKNPGPGEPPSSTAPSYSYSLSNKTVMPASTPKSSSKSGTHGLYIHSQKAGVFTYLPLSWVPYAELMRIHKPVGTLNVFFPHLFGSLFAGCVLDPFIRPRLLLMRIGALLGAAFVLRSAGCSWNDIADRDLDRLVERTRLRPMARGAISLPAAYVFTATQVGI